MSILLGADGAAKAVKAIYVGVDGQPRKVKEGYVGVEGRPRLFLRAEKLAPNLQYSENNTPNTYYLYVESDSDALLNWNYTRSQGPDPQQGAMGTQTSAGVLALTFQAEYRDQTLVGTLKVQSPETDNYAFGFLNIPINTIFGATPPPEPTNEGV